MAAHCLRGALIYRSPKAPLRLQVGCSWLLLANLRNTPSCPGGGTSARNLAPLPFPAFLGFASLYSLARGRGPGVGGHLRRCGDSVQGGAPRAGQGRGRGVAGCPGGDSTPSMRQTWTDAVKACCARGEEGAWGRMGLAGPGLLCQLRLLLSRQGATGSSEPRGHGLAWLVQAPRGPAPLREQQARLHSPPAWPCHFPKDLRRHSRRPHPTPHPPPPHPRPPTPPSPPRCACPARTAAGSRWCCRPCCPQATRWRARPSWRSPGGTCQRTCWRLRRGTSARCSCRVGAGAGAGVASESGRGAGRQHVCAPDARGSANEDRRGRVAQGGRGWVGAAFTRFTLVRPLPSVTTRARGVMRCKRLCIAQAMSRFITGWSGSRSWTSCGAAPAAVGAAAAGGLERGTRMMMRMGSGRLTSRPASAKLPRRYG